ncbi:MAG: ParB-like protein [Roseiarcus sp.]
MAYHIREPILHPTPILSLRPTQMTLGMREVEEKRNAWRAFDHKKLGDFLNSHMVPVILGPNKKPYLTDHHHLARALHDNGVESVFTTVIADLQRLDEEAFWTVLDFHAWTHPYDRKGRRRSYSELPKTIADMTDDPFRSLAGELRRLGGFAKDSSPFAEFLWADFLRRRIKTKAVEKDFEAALARALELSIRDEANYLPGWCAAHPSSAATRGDKIEPDPPARAPKPGGAG